MMMSARHLSVPHKEDLKAKQSSVKINLLNTRAEPQKTVGSNMMPMK